MTLRLELPFRGFFTPDEKSAVFPKLVEECFARRGTLSVEFGPETVVVTVEAEDNGTRGLRLFGDWRATEFQGLRADEAGVKLVLPFVFNVTGIRLPNCEIYTLGRECGPISDLFVRNVFFAMGRNAPVVVEERGQYQSGLLAAKEFRHQYFFVLKSFLREDVCESQPAGEMIELIYANAFIPIVSFRNALLTRGSEQLRRVTRCWGSETDLRLLKERLMAARILMLTHCGP